MMDYFVDNLFENHVAFFNEWKDFTPDVIAALELVSIASKADNSGLWNTGCQIRSFFYRRCRSFILKHLLHQTVSSLVKNLFNPFPPLRLVFALPMGSIGLSRRRCFRRQKHYFVE